MALWNNVGNYLSFCIKLFKQHSPNSSPFPCVLARGLSYHDKVVHRDLKVAGDKGKYRTNM